MAVVAFVLGLLGSGVLLIRDCERPQSIGEVSKDDGDFTKNSKKDYLDSPAG